MLRRNPNKPQRGYVWGDLEKIAAELDVSVTTVRHVLAGNTPKGRPSLRVYRALIEGGKEHWIAKPEGSK